MIGTTLGHYRIVEKIGAGGMGEVYRAIDERLDRDVAIKVLPEEVAEDPERLARFEREAKLLASLSHQNIATLHGLEEYESQRYLVMELAEGDTLAERIEKGPIPVDDALDYACQIAEGLEAAHEQGIIHRDLKPANVMISPEGKVKILDFGLAKAWRPEEGDTDLTHSPTQTAQMTAAGVLLGTAAYMSPEQARGKPVDKRTDVWSFGCVLFEMLTGATCHQGETVSDTLVGILARAPDWESLPKGSPPLVHRLLRRCLEKDPQRRLRDIGEARIALEDLETGALNGGTDDGAGQSPTSRRSWRALPWVIAAATAGAALAVGWVASRPEPPRAPTRLAVDLPSDLRLSITLSNPLAVSPDGSRLAFVASRDGDRPRLYLRELNRFGASSIPGTEGADGPFFSPDGQWIAFFTDKKLRKVSVLGGAPLDICDVPQLNPGATWGADGTIVISTDRFGLMRVPASGGTAEQLTAPKLAAGETIHAWPCFLPDGEHLLFTVRGSRGPRVALLSLGTGEWRELAAGGGSVSYLPTGHLLYPRAGGLTAIGFDLDRLETVGQPFPILEDVYAGPGLKGVGQGAFSVSETGVLAYVPGGAAAAETRLVWVDREGRSTPLAADPSNYEWPRLSPDGSRVAVTDRTADGAIDIWVLGVERGTRSRLTGGGNNILATWAPGGEAVFFGSHQAGPGGLNIYRKPVDGAGEAEQVLVREHPLFPMDTTADGRSLLFVEWNPKTARDIWTMTLEGDRRAEPVLVTSFDEYRPMLSPDGRWLAYVSDESGRYEVYVQSWPEGASRTLVSAHGGTGPTWSADSTELFYQNGEAMMAVPVESGTSFSIGTPELLFEGRYKLGVYGSISYDVSADGRFLMMERSREATADRLHVVLDWFEELKRLAPTE
jgi:Tol biopolymer transport system component